MSCSRSNLLVHHKGEAKATSSELNDCRPNLILPFSQTFICRTIGIDCSPKIILPVHQAHSLRHISELVSAVLHWSLRTLSIAAFTTPRFLTWSHWMWLNVGLLSVEQVDATILPMSFVHMATPCGMRPRTQALPRTPAVLDLPSRRPLPSRPRQPTVKYLDSFLVYLAEA